MRLRLRMLQGATALLYMGPLLAGLAGYGWLMLPPFLSIFVIWLILLRPHQWPQTAGEWLRPEALGAVLTQVLSQVLLVACLFGVARGIGGVTGALPMLHPFLPLAVSAFAICLARVLWDGERAAAQGQTIDELLYPSSRRPGRARRASGGADLVSGLLALPDGLPADQALAHLDEVLDEADPVSGLAALSSALMTADPSRHGGLRAGLILWATDPGRFASASVPGALPAAFAAAGADAGLLRLLLPRATALARALPDRVRQFPDAGRIEALAQTPLPFEIVEALFALSRHLRDPAAMSRADKPPAGLRTA